MIRWRYVGRGEALLDVPARDLYADEDLTAAQVAAIEDSALYLAVA